LRRFVCDVMAKIDWYFSGLSDFKTVCK